MCCPTCPRTQPIKPLPGRAARIRNLFPSMHRHLPSRRDPCLISRPYLPAEPESGGNLSRATSSWVDRIFVEPQALDFRLCHLHRPNDRGLIHPLRLAETSRARLVLAKRRIATSPRRKFPRPSARRLRAIRILILTRSRNRYRSRTNRNWSRMYGPRRQTSISSTHLPAHSRIRLYLAPYLKRIRSPVSRSSRVNSSSRLIQRVETTLRSTPAFRHSRSLRRHHLDPILDTRSPPARGTRRAHLHLAERHRPAVKANLKILIRQRHRYRHRPRLTPTLMQVRRHL